MGSTGSARSSQIPAGVPMTAPTSSQRSDRQCTSRHTLGRSCTLASTSSTNEVGIAEDGGSTSESPITHTIDAPKPPKPRTAPPSTTTTSTSTQANGGRLHTVEPMDRPPPPQCRIQPSSADMPPASTSSPPTEGTTTRAPPARRS
jgi:hypothetical protein